MLTVLERMAICLVVAVPLFSGQYCPGDEWYQPRDTWPATMQATRTAIRAALAGTGFVPARTEIIRGGEPATLVVIDIHGAETLCLKAGTGVDGYNYDQAIWGEPTLVAADGARVALSSIKPLSVQVGWGQLETDRNHAGQPLRVGDSVFAHGFWAHAPSELNFKLDSGKFVRFEAFVGIDAGAGTNGSAAFEVSNGLSEIESVWLKIERDFPQESAWFEEDLGRGAHLAWFEAEETQGIERRLIQHVLEPLGITGLSFHAEQQSIHSEVDSGGVLDLYVRAAQARQHMRAITRQLARVNVEALRRAVMDLAASFPDTYADGKAFMTVLDSVQDRIESLRAEAAQGNPDALTEAENLLVRLRGMSLANPLLNFDEILLVRRAADAPALGLPQNWQGNCSLPGGAYKNEIGALRWKEPNQAWRVIYRPEPSRFAGDVDLHFDGGLLLFSMPDARGKYQIYEITTEGTELRQLTPGKEPDVDNYDGCYLPDGRIVYASSACYHGIPCVFGGDAVANLCLMNRDGSGMRQLCVDQDHNWCPTMLNNGRVMYLRWEYGDLPHSNSRILFHMNPDGTAQMEYYGSNSYWPNGVFFARPIPGHPSEFVGIVSGHHGVRRMGELVLFDAARGRNEAGGVVQRIPGWGQPVAPVQKDRLVDESWPKFLHPYPLSDKYFLVAAQPDADAAWGLYLVDVFDNMLLLYEEPGQAFLEPIPLRKTPRPPVIPDRVAPGRKDAVVYLADIYRGPGLDGVPAGTVKKLRLFSYTFSYRGMGGLLGTIGMDGPWDIRNILGTVPVEEDGSALFRVPANTPIAVQPLDAEGKAVQLMRSWFTAMPGETLSCVGCHEKQNMTPVPGQTLASRRSPSEIAPWFGPARGFSFAREVQPVLDRRCLGCHNGQTPPNLRGDLAITDWNSDISGHASPDVGGKFSLAYAELHRYVRRPGIESDFHLLSPMEYHADTTELVQILQRDHYGVRLNDEEWSRILTWIDFNAPFHGAWSEILGKERVEPVAQRRRELKRAYLGVEEDAENLPPLPAPVAFEAPGKTAAGVEPAALPGWPWPPAEAQLRQVALGTVRRTLEMAGGLSLDMVLIPAGEFLMGDTEGGPEERPQTPVRIDAPFWMSAREITNEQYRVFDPEHDSRIESKHGYQFGVHGYPLNEPSQPVVRVSLEQASAFCEWLSGKTGERIVLPTEAQWEYACRAGSGTPFSFGTAGADFAAFGNLGDLELERFASNPYLIDAPLPHPNKYDDWIPHDVQVRDNGFLSTPAGSYLPNAWGLHDMHGNVWEWTTSALRPYPYMPGDGREQPGASEKRVVRGGSWYDRPSRCTASYRLAYAPWQRVFNVGFRVICAVHDTVASNLTKEKE